MMKNFLELLKEKILVFDGATGSNLQNFNLTADDFGGKDLEGCNEYLCISKPEVVKKLHRSFLEAGADERQPRDRPPLYRESACGRIDHAGILHAPADRGARRAAAPDGLTGD